jgi:hypothetical protein
MPRSNSAVLRSPSSYWSMHDTQKDSLKHGAQAKPKFSAHTDHHHLGCCNDTGCRIDWEFSFFGVSHPS